MSSSSKSSISMTVRVAALTAALICVTLFFVRHELEQFPTPRFLTPKIQQPKATQVQFQEASSQSPPFQLKLNSKYALSRYMRHQPEFGPFKDALAIVTSETSQDEPLLLTLNFNDHSLRFHSLASSSAQQISIVPHGNYPVG